MFLVRELARQQLPKRRRSPWLIWIGILLFCVLGYIAMELK